MGLDMYLHAKRFISEHFDENLYVNVNKAIKDLHIPGHGKMPVKWIECEAMYWRKANAIHRWFVKNVQEEVDDCKSYWVSIEQLDELLETCKKVLADRDNASAILPCQSGFFFGSEDYDEWYFQDVERTVKELEKILATPGIEHWDFQYHSSW